MRVLLCTTIVVAICSIIANGTTLRSTGSPATSTSTVANNASTKKHSTTTSTTVAQKDVIQRTPTASTTGFALKMKSSTIAPGNDTSSDASSLAVQRVHRKRLRTRSPATSQPTTTTGSSSAATSAPSSRKAKSRDGHRRHQGDLSVKVSAANANANLTSSATSNQAATASAPAQASEKAGDEQPVNDGGGDDGVYEIDDPRYYTFSKSSRYSSSLGHDPEFSSSEQYHMYQGDEIGQGEQTAHSKRDDRNARPSDTQATSTKSNCHMMRKPMPSYANYEGAEGSNPISDKKSKMMMCYVCGDKGNPYADGGYREECNYSPSKLRQIVASSEQVASYANQPDDSYRQSATSNKEQLYAGKGQSPYLSSQDHSSGGRRHRRRHHRQNPHQHQQENYNDGAGYDQNPDTASTGHHDSKNEGGDSNDGAGTETCKVQYRGKMKCKVCGDPKSDAVFSEQCDYEKDNPEQHRSSSYDLGSTNEKSYKSRPEKNGGSHSHSGGSHGNGGKDNGGHDGGHDESGGQDDGYRGGGGGGYDDGYNYPDYYGSGSGYHSDPYYGSGSDLYGYGGYGPDYYGYGSDGGHGGDSGHGSDGGHSGSRGNDGGTHGSNSGAKDSKGHEQPQASTTHESGGKDAGAGKAKKDCKVIYKDFADVSPYAPRSNSNGKSNKDKPKMKCMVCTNSGGFGGVTEECSYSGGGSLAAASAFPSPSYSFDRPLESLYPIDFDQYHDAFF